MEIQGISEMQEIQGYGRYRDTGDTGIQNKQTTEDTRIQGYKRNKDKGDRGI